MMIPKGGEAECVFPQLPGHAWFIVDLHQISPDPSTFPELISLTVGLDLLIYLVSSKKKWDGFKYNGGCW